MNALIFNILLFNIVCYKIDWHCKNRTDIIISENREEYFISQMYNNTCNTKICPADRAECSNITNTCNCKKGYATFPFISDKYCQYKQTSSITILLLEIFLPFGISHFLVGKIKYGFIKLSLCLVPWILGILGEFRVINIKYFQGTIGLLTSIFLFLGSLSFFAMYLFDIFYIGLFDDLRDTNCVPLNNLFS